MDTLLVGKQLGFAGRQRNEMKVILEFNITSFVCKVFEIHALFLSVFTFSTRVKISDSTPAMAVQ